MSLFRTYSPLWKQKHQKKEADGKQFIPYRRGWPKFAESYLNEFWPNRYEPDTVGDGADAVEHFMNKRSTTSFSWTHHAVPGMGNIEATKRIRQFEQEENGKTLVPS